jgi:hypothetical protein
MGYIFGVTLIRKIGRTEVTNRVSIPGEKSEQSCLKVHKTLRLIEAHKIMINYIDKES